VITSGATGSVAENAASSTVIYTAQASDVDTGTTLTYSLGGADASLLDIDASTGAVTLKASANFEVKSSYSFNVIATDNGTGSLSDTKAVAITVTDVNEAPTAVGTVAAQTAVNGQVFSLDVHGYFADVDAGNNGTLSYSATGLPTGITIDSSTGVISGTASADRSSAVVVVTATDGGSLFANQSFNLGVVSAPAITGLASNVAVANSGDALNLTATVSEAVTVNTSGGTPTLTLDVDGQTLTATYSGGSGTTSLTFTATAGAGDDSTVTVTAINLNGGTITGNTTAQDLLTTATGQVVPSFIVDNTNPVFTSGATANFAENGSGNAYASAVTDATTVTYTLGGTDAALFNISSMGAVTFKTAPDFEAAGDNGSNNVYDVTVTATDAAGNQNTKAVAITVTDVNEAPSITSGATASFAENGTGAVYTATATDPDAGTTLAYTLGGTDANLFNIDASTGVVTFKTAPDFEAPADAGANNVYDISVTATDNGTGSLSDTKAVAITVTNVNEAPVITTTAPLSVTKGNTYTYQLSASDVDMGDQINATATTLPSWLSFDPETLTLTGTPSGDHLGASEVTIEVTDGSQSTSQNFVINVNNTIGSVIILVDQFSDRIFDLGHENLTLFDYSELSVQRWFDYQYNGLTFYDDWEYIVADPVTGFYQITPDEDVSPYPATFVTATTKDFDYDLITSGSGFDQFLGNYLYEDYFVLSRLDQSSDDLPNHGDWALEALLQQLDNPEKTEIIAIDLDTLGVAGNHYDKLFEQVAFSIPGVGPVIGTALEKIVYDWYVLNHYQFTGNANHSDYSLAALSISIAGKPADTELPALIQLENFGVPIVQSATNIEFSSPLDWSSVFTDVISVGAWNVDSNGNVIFSNEAAFEQVDILADGLVSKAGWGAEFGTSFATPRVTAEIANIINDFIEYLEGDGISLGEAQQANAELDTSYSELIASLIQTIGTPVSFKIDDSGDVTVYLKMVLSDDLEPSVQPNSVNFVSVNEEVAWGVITDIEILAMETEIS
jgi:hypothetical protein